MSNLLGLSKKSREKLATCHPDLQKVVEHVAAWFPLTVIYGHRGKDEQDVAVRSGASQLPFPKSKHNAIPSNAVDIAPLKWTRERGAYVDWDDWREFSALAGAMLATARFLGVKLAWGADWDSDWDLEEHKLQDGPHFELVESE